MYKIEFGKSLGPLRIGMDKNEAYKILPDIKAMPSGINHQEIQYVSKPYTFYCDENDKIEYISSYNFEGLEYEGKALGWYTVKEFIDIIKKLDSSAEIDNDAIESNLGVSLFSHEDGCFLEAPNKILQNQKVAFNIAITKENYFKTD